MKKYSTICKDIQMVLTVFVLIAAVQFMNSCGGGDSETTTVVIDNHVYVMTV